MKKMLLFALFFGQGALVASEILIEHSGNFICRCTHAQCKTNTPDVLLTLDRTSNRLIIDYGEEIQSGAPARTSFREGSATYILASKGTVSFSAKNEMRFGWGKLWTCERK